MHVCDFWSILRCLFVEFFKLLSKYLCEAFDSRARSFAVSLVNQNKRSKIKNRRLSRRKNASNGYTISTHSKFKWIYLRRTISNPFPLIYVDFRFFTWQNHEPTIRNKPTMPSECCKPFQIDNRTHIIGWDFFFFLPLQHKVMNIAWSQIKIKIKNHWHARNRASCV